MKKNFKYFSITWLVGFLLFNAIVFLIPNKVFGVTRFDKGVFWIAYALIALSFIAQIITAYIFIKDDQKEKMFLRIPLLKTGYTSVIVSAIVGLAFMIFPALPAWLGAIVCLLVTGYFILACVNASTTSNIVAEIDEKVKTKTAFIRTAIVETENMLLRAQTTEIKAEIKKVCEALRYSDPMSAPALEQLEGEIEENLQQLKIAVTNNDVEKTPRISAELFALIQERNNKCKLLK